MTLEEFNSLKKDAIFYRISTTINKILKYKVNKRKNNICYVSFLVDYETLFTYEDTIKYECFLYKNLIDYLSKIPKDNLVKILHNKFNEETLKDIKIHFVEYLI